MFTVMQQTVFLAYEVRSQVSACIVPALETQREKLHKGHISAVKVVTKHSSGVIVYWPGTDLPRSSPTMLEHT